VLFQLNNANRQDPSDFSVGEGLVELGEIPPPLAGESPPNYQRETTRVSPTY